jgi:NAD dependent epimerase/dehydratase family enzyme
MVVLPENQTDTNIQNKSSVMISGGRVSSEKIENARYRFLFIDLEDALKNVIYD